MNAPFHSQNHMQSYNPSQQHGTLPPPQHLGTPSFGGVGTTSTSPFSIGGHINASFDRGMQDAGIMTGQGAMGFGRGIPGQQQAFDGLPHARPDKDDSRIRNVWKQNLAQEMAMLRRLVEEYPYIAMDTEFPGIVARPIGQFTTKADYHYQTLRCNVDLLKMIQLGVTLFRPDGSLPPGDPPSPSKFPSMSNVVAPYTWQFNFKFSLESDMYAHESTAMLSKAGIDFDRHSKQGIEPESFGAYLISSGMVLDPDVHWISFHSGYDFAYLMKLMICKPLPDDEADFHIYLDKFFPSLFDIKFMLKHASAKGSVNNNQPLTGEAQVALAKLFSKGGLQDIAEELAVPRIGQAHQAGSDSLLTGQVYFKMKEKIFNGTVDESKYCGQVWGLNAQMPLTNAPGGNREYNSTPNINGATFYSHQNQNGVNMNPAPSTPQTGNAGMVGQSGTPGPPQSSHGLGGMMGNTTPGGFGAFHYNKAAMS
jgi:CCR4-NOT transcription complex subunit 7/8